MLRREKIYLVDVMWWNRLKLHHDLILTFLKYASFFIINF